MVRVPGPGRAPDPRSIPAPGFCHPRPSRPSPPRAPSPCPERHRILGSRCFETYGPLAPSETSDPAGPRNTSDDRRDPARDSPGLRDPQPLLLGRIL
ncbi:transmembrane protein 145-like [Lontra canadensis]|uniref:transmembrane protein 145-like n=1 Tax=Lontra canadensis TaxID=76717 RepID=UPI0013F35C72|nr:transmembrane protein 145-like [Lontra canadensis]